MGDLRANAHSGAMASGTSRKAVFQVNAPANTGITLEEASFSFGDAATSDPKVFCELILGATGGSGSAVTPAKISGAGSVQATAKDTFSSDPSGGTLAGSLSVHPLNGCVFRNIEVPPGGSATWFVTTTTSKTTRNYARWKE